MQERDKQDSVKSIRTENESDNRPSKIRHTKAPDNEAFGDIGFTPQISKNKPISSGW